jgi:hypothetical protein
MKTGLDLAKEHLRFNLSDICRTKHPEIHNVSHALYLVVESLERIERRLEKLELPPAKAD